jgi:hypothetical protein
MAALGWWYEGGGARRIGFCFFFLLCFGGTEPGTEWINKQDTQEYAGIFGVWVEKMVGEKRARGSSARVGMGLCLGWKLDYLGSIFELYVGMYVLVM